MTADRGGRRRWTSAPASSARSSTPSAPGAAGRAGPGRCAAPSRPRTRRGGARLVRDGATVTLSLPLNTQAAAHNPKPAVHHMTMLPDVDIGSGSLRFAKDYVAFDYHSDTYSHIDALCHVAFEGRLYNGHPAPGSPRGAPRSMASRRSRTASSAAACCSTSPGCGVRPGSSPASTCSARSRGRRAGPGGDRRRWRHPPGPHRPPRRLAELGPWDTAAARAGLHPTAMPFVAERRVAALGSDGNSDAAPSMTEGVAFPVHVLAINAMGVRLLDYLQLEDLRQACEAAGRWEFLFMAAPLRISAGRVPPSTRSRSCSAFGRATPGPARGTAEVRCRLAAASVRRLAARRSAL